MSRLMRKVGQACTLLCSRQPHHKEMLYMTNGFPSGMMRIRPLTHVECSVHRNQDVIVLRLEAQAETESGPQIFEVGLEVGLTEQQPGLLVDAS